MQMSIPLRLAASRALLLAMISLQALALIVRWLLMPAPDWLQLLALLLYAAVVGTFVIWMPGSLAARLGKASQTLVQNERLLILALCLFVLLAGIVNVAFQRTTPDEARNFVAAQIVADEGLGSFFSRYAAIPWLGYQHPPLAPLLYGFAMRILGTQVLVMRLVTLLMGLAVALTTYWLGKECYDRETGLLASLSLLAIPSFFRLSSLANNDMLVMLFFSLAVLLTLRLLRTSRVSLAILTGLVIGAGLLSKYTMGLIYPVFVGSLVVFRRLGRLKLRLGVAVAASVLVVAAWLLAAQQMGVLSIQAKRLAGLSGIGTPLTSSWGLLSVGRMRWRIDQLLTGTPNGVGVWNLPLLLLGGWLLVRHRSRPDLVILCWLVFVLVPVAIILPDPRYFSLAAPALALTMARGLQAVPGIKERAILLGLFCVAQALYLYVVITQVAHVL
jgi:4-amino-4-deoxy-L-arabinose transferase-like glycosyltransferase